MQERRIHLARQDVVKLMDIEIKGSNVELFTENDPNRTSENLEQLKAEIIHDLRICFPDFLKKDSS